LSVLSALSVSKARCAGRAQTVKGNWSSGPAEMI
jgi:hypothetical protein